MPLTCPSSLRPNSAVQPAFPTSRKQSVRSGRDNGNNGVQAEGRLSAGVKTSIAWLVQDWRINLRDCR
jgi:hypothetical protein